MSTIIYPSSYNIELYKQIKDIIQKPIDVSRLPITEDIKIFKQSAKRYGHIIIRLDLETEGDFYGSLAKYNYKWEVEERVSSSNDYYVSIPKTHEPTIVKELEVFTLLLDFLNYDAPPLRFTVLGGSFRVTERPYFDRVTAEALIQIFNQLHKD